MNTLLTVKEAAELVDRTEGNIRKLIRTKKLPYRKLEDRTIRIQKKDLVKYYKKLSKKQINPINVEHLQSSVDNAQYLLDQKPDSDTGNIHQEAYDQLHTKLDELHSKLESLTNTLHSHVIPNLQIVLNNTTVKKVEEDSPAQIDTDLAGVQNKPNEANYPNEKGNKESPTDEVAMEILGLEEEVETLQQSIQKNIQSADTGKTQEEINVDVWEQDKPAKTKRTSRLFESISLKDLKDPEEPKKTSEIINGEPSNNHEAQINMNRSLGSEKEEGRDMSKEDTVNEINNTAIYEKYGEMFSNPFLAQASFQRENNIHHRSLEDEKNTKTHPSNHSTNTGTADTPKSEVSSSIESYDEGDFVPDISFSTSKLNNSNVANQEQNKHQDEAVPSSSSDKSARDMSSIATRSDDQNQAQNNQSDQLHQESKSKKWFWQR